jgi:putative ABC transport system substrate-binding protein
MASIPIAVVAAQFDPVERGYVASLARPGGKAADVPVEQATKFETVINLKTAKAIGIDLPTSILLLADE